MVLESGSDANGFRLVEAAAAVARSPKEDAAADDPRCAAATAVSKQSGDETVAVAVEGNGGICTLLIAARESQKSVFAPRSAAVEACEGPGSRVPGPSSNWAAPITLRASRGLIATSGSTWLARLCLDCRPTGESVSERQRRRAISRCNAATLRAPQTIANELLVLPLVCPCCIRPAISGQQPPLVTRAVWCTMCCRAGGSRRSVRRSAVRSLGASRWRDARRRRR